MKNRALLDRLGRGAALCLVLLCCLLVRRDNWLDLDEGYAGGLAAADLGLRQRERGKWFVFTPHAQAVMEQSPLLLSGRKRNPQDVQRFAERWGTDLRDPCYSPRFGKQKANYRY